MNKFKVISEFTPKGDQPAAIQKLKRGIDSNIDFQTLMGITGSGKSATIAWLIEEVQKPTLVLAPNKALAAQLANVVFQDKEKLQLLETYLHPKVQSQLVDNLSNSDQLTFIEVSAPKNVIDLSLIHI